jgi:hypothetical protein
MAGGKRTVTRKKSEARKQAATPAVRAPQVSFPDVDGLVGEALEKWQQAEREQGRVTSKAEIARRSILRAWKERGSKGESP